MRTKPKWHRIRQHEIYTVSEAALCLGVHQRTLRRWAEAGGLEIYNSQKPHLVRGIDLKAFGNARKREKLKCRPHEAWCFSCRSPQSAAFNEAEIAEASGTAPNLRMLCGSCSAVMHKRVSWNNLETLSAQLVLSAQQALQSLIEMKQPCLNVHYLEEN